MALSLKWNVSVAFQHCQEKPPKGPINPTTRLQDTGFAFRYNVTDDSVLSHHGPRALWNFPRQDELELEEEGWREIYWESLGESGYSMPEGKGSGHWYNM